MKNLLFIAPIVFLLPGCNDNDTPADVLRDPVVSVNNDTPALSDIAGVWDSSTEEGQQKDENYFEVLPSGAFVFYDYAGDGHDQGDSCYWQGDYSISDAGNGEFTLLYRDTEILSFSASLASPLSS